ncbi:MAG TPA: hypothetical protein VJC16_00685 [Candidatus Nanoarchaeia archaeon]|nr:hypothetical protein [Candidatus Nanoarchaeia archaeon]
MIENEEDVALLLTVNKTNRRWPSRQHPDDVYGTIFFQDDPYLVHIRAYYLEGRRKRIGNIRVQQRVLQKLFA